MLSGIKTYIWAACAVAYAAGGFFTGNLDATHAMDIVIGSGFVATLRSALNSVLPAAFAKLGGTLLDMVLEKKITAVPQDTGQAPQPK